MQRTLALASLLFLAACASGPRSTVASGTRIAVTEVRGPGFSTGPIRTTEDRMTASAAVAAPPERAWPALSRVYQELGIPVTTVDQSTRLLGSTGQRVRRVGGKGMAQFFECIGPYGNAASSYDVYLSVRTQLVAGEGGGTEARTQAEAFAKPQTSGQGVPCTTKGALEKMIGDRLRETAEAPAR